MFLNSDLTSFLKLLFLGMSKRITFFTLFSPSPPLLFFLKIFGEGCLLLFSISNKCREKTIVNPPHWENLKLVQVGK